MPDFRRLRIAVAAVFAVFAFLVAFFLVSDRLGGGSPGYAVSALIALLFFLAAFALAPRFVTNARASKSRESPQPAAATTIAPVERAESLLVETSVEESGEETIFDDRVEVPPGRQGWDYEIPLDVGDTLEGSLREIDGQAFNWMIMTEANYYGWINGEDPDHVEGEEDVRAVRIEWKVPRPERWFLVIDAYGKQYPRDVRVHLRRVWKAEESR